MERHLTATESHLPYGITQCYRSPDTSEHTPPYLMTYFFSLSLQQSLEWVNVLDLTRVACSRLSGHTAI